MENGDGAFEGRESRFQTTRGRTLVREGAGGATRHGGEGDGAAGDPESGPRRTADESRAEPARPIPAKTCGVRGSWATGSYRVGDAAGRSGWLTIQSSTNECSSRSRMNSSSLSRLHTLPKDRNNNIQMVPKRALARTRPISSALAAANIGHRGGLRRWLAGGPVRHCRNLRLGLALANSC